MTRWNRAWSDGYHMWMHCAALQLQTHKWSSDKALKSFCMQNTRIMQICSLLPTPIPLHSSFTPLWITSFGLQAPASSCLVWVLEISRYHRPGLVFHPKFCTRTPGSSKSHTNTTKTATFCPFLPFITPERSHYNWGSNKHVIEGITLPEGLQIPRDLRASWALPTW